MKKRLATYALIFFLGVGVMASAHATSSPSLSDIFNILGVVEPTLLPDSTFYFIKDWGRGIHLFFTFDSAKKAELEARFADEKLAELEKIAAEKPNENNALDRAFQNYLDARARLTFRLESLKGKNKNIDALLEKIADQTIEHQKLFDDLQGIADEEILKNATKEIGNTAKKALELDEKTFKEKIKEKIRHDEDDTEDIDALENLNDSDNDLNESLGDIQDELETEQGASIQESHDLDDITKDLEEKNSEEIPDKDELREKKPNNSQKESEQTQTGPTESETKPVSSVSQEQEFKMEADDFGFYPSNAITIPRGAKVKIDFLVRTANVYYGGLRFVAPVFTVSAKPGEKAEAEFTANDSFTVTSYWPLTDVKKADLQIQVK